MNCGERKECACVCVCVFGFTTEIVNYRLMELTKRKEGKGSQKKEGRYEKCSV